MYSLFKNYIFSSDAQEEVNLIKLFQNGFALNKIEPKSRVERKKFCLCLEMCRLEWYKPMPGSEEFESHIDLRDIKEIRVDSDSISFGIKTLLNNPVISILYGRKFCLNKLSCLSKPDECL